MPVLILVVGGVLIGFSFLIVSLLTENAGWAWGCLAACAVSAGVLVVDARSRRSARGGPARVETALSEPEENSAESSALELDPEVLVVDEHPHFHTPDCAWVEGHLTMGLPASEATALGFTPCDRCSNVASAAETAAV